MTLSLNAPIEDLKLSRRVRNVLRRGGFSTLASLRKRNYKPALRGFGPTAQAELASALEANGFLSPANSPRCESGDVAEDVSKLRGQMEASFREWNAQMERLEIDIRKLMTSRLDEPFLEEGSGEQAPAAVTDGLAHEFQVGLLAVHIASDCLLEIAELPPKQQALMTLVVEQSDRLIGLIHQLLGAPPKSPASCSASLRKRSRRITHGRAEAELNAANEFEAPAASPIRLDEILSAPVENRSDQLRLQRL
jgi:signal transduction histidine kinase